MCLLTNESYKTFQMGFSLGLLGHAPGVMLGSQNLNFLNLVMWHIKLKGMDDQQTRIQMKNFTLGFNW